MEQRHFEKVTLIQLMKNSPFSVKPEISLPCPQEPTIRPYPEPDVSSQHPLTLFP
jgi:hypothetical protein